MTKKLEVRIMPDGRIVAETHGVVGPKCEEYAKLLAKIVGGEITKMERKPEYYEQEKAIQPERQSEKLDNNKG